MVACSTSDRKRYASVSCAGKETVSGCFWQGNGLPTLPPLLANIRACPSHLESHALSRPRRDLFGRHRHSERLVVRNRLGVRLFSALAPAGLEHQSSVPHAQACEKLCCEVCVYSPSSPELHNTMYPPPNAVCHLHADGAIIVSGRVFVRRVVLTR